MSKVFENAFNILPNPRSSFDPEGRILRISVHYKFLYLFDAGICRAGREVVFEGFDHFRASLHKRLDGPVVQVSNIAFYLMPGRGALGKVAETNSLYYSANQELPSDHKMKLLSKTFKAFRQWPLPTCVNRHAAHRKTGCGRLTEFFGQGEKVLRFVSFERDQVFLVAETECMRKMYLNVRKTPADHEVLFDQCVPLLGRFLIPIPVFRTRVKKMVFLLARRYIKPVGTRVRHEHHPLGYGKIAVGRLKETAKPRSEHCRGHFLYAIHRSADAPEHQVSLRIKTNQAVAEKEKVILKAVEYCLKLTFAFVLLLLIKLSPRRIYAQKNEVYELFFQWKRLRGITVFTDKPQAACIGRVFLGIYKLDRHNGCSFAVKSLIKILQVSGQLSKVGKFNSRRSTREAPHKTNQAGAELGCLQNIPLNATISPVRFALLLILLAITVLPSAAQQRPLLTDDIDITPQGAIEIGVGVDFMQNVKFPLSGLKGDLTRVGDIRIRQGFASNVELQIEGAIQNFLAINSQTTPSPIPLNIDGNSTNDFDDFVVSAKVKLFSETKNLPAIGMKFGYQMPNTDQAKGIGTNQINIFSKLIVQKKFGVVTGKAPKANIFANIGLGIMSAPLEDFAQNDVILYGLAGIFRVTDHINAVAEVNGRANTRSGGAPLGTESVGQFRVGAQIRASGLRFDTAALFGLTKYSPRSGITFGVTYETPAFIPIAK